MTLVQRKFGVVIVGGGPAGLAVLLAAHRDGRLDEMLRRGVLIVEQSAHIGKGKIGDYAINSDSTGFTWIDPLNAGEEGALHKILETPIAQLIAAAGPAPVPLRDAGKLLALIGQTFHSIIDRYPRSAVLTSCTAESAQRQPDGSWRLVLASVSRSRISVKTKCLVIATGGSQPLDRLEREKLSGVPILQRWGDRLMQSGEVIAAGGLARVAKQLEGKASPRVAILGGSTSAMSVAHALLHRLSEIRFNQNAITLFHRRPLHIYYTSPEEALADGYTEFGPSDICPLTKRVYRLAGFRLDSRELLLQLRNIGGRPPEPRMRLHRLEAEDPNAISLIDAADLVVAALGYRPNALRILDEQGSEVPLFAHTGPSKPMVDDRCRVMDQTGDPIAGLFGIGLAAGFVPQGKLGGEPSFTGQANGLWLWQNDVGSMIVKAVLPPTSILARNRRSTAQRSANEKPNGLVAQSIAAAAGRGA